MAMNLVNKYIKVSNKEGVTILGYYIELKIACMGIVIKMI
jgi:hypothetical protein